MIEINGKEYVMRGLKTQDIYFMSRILKKMNIKIDATGKDSAEQVGVDLMMKVAENLHQAQDEVSAFLGGMISMDKEVFDNLEIEDTIKVLNEFKQLKGLSGFFQLVAKSM